MSLVELATCISCACLFNLIKIWCNLEHVCIMTWWWLSALYVLVFFHREFYAGFILQPPSSEKKRATSELGPAVQFGPWKFSTCQLSVLHHYRGVWEVESVPALSRDPTCSELFSQHRQEELEKLGGDWHHFIFSASPKVSEKEHTLACQHHLPRGTKSQGQWLQRSPGDHLEVPSSTSLPQWHQ